MLTTVCHEHEYEYVTNTITSTGHDGFNEIYQSKPSPNHNLQKQMHIYKKTDMVYDQNGFLIIILKNLEQETCEKKCT